MGKIVCTFAFFVGLAANVLVAQAQQPDSNIGIGNIGSGYGSGPGGGSYYVEINIKTSARYGRVLHESGHSELYCKVANLPASQCGAQYSSIDGVKLSYKSGQSYGGLAPSSRSIYKIEGSLNSANGSKWEWPREADITSASQRWARRKSNLLTLRFNNVHWFGSKINSVYRVKWKESDPGRVDDDSEWAYFNAGDMITACLQGPLGNKTLLPESAGYYWRLDSDGGIFGQYSIDVYYEVSCYLGGGSPPPPSTCEPNQCSNQCGGGQCMSGQCICF